MIHITTKDIEELDIRPEKCCEWILESFKAKHRCQLPPKISLHLKEIDFYNTMPCLLPNEYDCFSVKIVSRIKGNTPSLNSDVLLYKASTGELLAHIDANWITTMRTGAVATIATEYLKNSHATIYSFIGLGNTGRSTLQCLLPRINKKNSIIKLFKYKNHAERIIDEFSYTGIRFEICDSMEELVNGSDVIISCITQTDEILCPDDSLFKKGVLVIPVHTRGFQNCDLFFDKVLGDDEGHIKDFKYFSKFKYFGELGDVISGNNTGRYNDMERIISYNIGLGIHDAIFGYHIYNLIKQ